MSTTELPLTDRARQVLVFAEQEARRLRHEYVGTEHLLLGLLREQSGVAAYLLRELHVDLAKASREIEVFIAPGSHMRPGAIPHTPRTKNALAYAQEEAFELGHRCIGSEHLLLGLLREGDGVAAQVLMNMGLRLEPVRSELLQLLGPEHSSLPPLEASDNPYEPPLTPPPVHPVRSPSERTDWMSLGGLALGTLIAGVVATHPWVRATSDWVLVAIFLIISGTLLMGYVLGRWLKSGNS